MMKTLVQAGSRVTEKSIQLPTSLVEYAQTAEPSVRRFLAWTIAVVYALRDLPWSDYARLIRNAAAHLVYFLSALRYAVGTEINPVAGVGVLLLGYLLLALLLFNVLYSVSQLVQLGRYALCFAVSMVIRLLKAIIVAALLPARVVRAVHEA